MKEVFVFILVVLLSHVHSAAVNLNATEYRLKSDFDVVHYKIEITVEELKIDKPFKGSVAIQLKPKQETRVIKLHVGPKIKFENKNVEVTKKITEKIDIDPSTNFTTNEAEIIEIKLVKPVKIADGIIILSFKYYEGEFSNDMNGFYLSTYKKGDETKSIATTQFEATYARRAFPCLDEPQYKATFEITIINPEGYHAISNQAGISNTTNNVTTTVFKETPRMTTYSLAFIVSDFKDFPVKYEDYLCGYDNKSECESRILTSEDFQKNAKYAVEETPKILKKLNEFTQTNYWDMGVNKLDQIAIPDFSAGAMENWGLVTYRETALLIDDQKSTERDKQGVTTVIAHEFSHMWFGNFVTLKWWDFTWLNEGFATFSEYFITDLIHNFENDHWEMEQQFVVEQIHPVLVTDAFQKSKSLNNQVETQTNIQAKFDSISYNKGASILRMLEQALGGRKNFTDKIHNYLTAGKEIVEPKDLYEAIDNPGEKIWSDFMNTWTEQEGYPIITVNRKKGETTTVDEQIIEVKQERFLYEQPKTTESKIWHIPLTYATKNEEITKPDLKMITKTTDGLTIPKGDFLIFNVDQTGFYRVKYEDELLYELQKTLKEKNSSIPIISRAQIVDDYMNFARAGKIDYVKAFEVISFLENETEYLPWYAALNSFSFLRRRFAEEDIRNSIDEQMKKMMENVIMSVDFGTKNVQHFEMLKKVLILKWTCEINSEAHVKVAKELFEAYKNEQKTPETSKDSVLNANLQGIVLCAGLRNSDKEEDWEFVKGLLKTKTFPQEQATIVTSLGCTKNEKHLNEYLEMTLDDTSFRKQDKMDVFNAVLTGTPKGVEVAFQFLQKHYIEIEKSFKGLNALSGMINKVADRLTSKTQMEEFQIFLEKNKDVLKVDVDEIAEILKTNGEWIEKNEKLLREYYKIPGGGAAGLTISTFLLLITTFIIKNL